MSFKDHDLEHNPNDLLLDTYRYKMMVVDDSSMARKLIKNHAKEINVNIVCEASNAEEAYQNYLEFEPDVVTMDISMPGQSGLEAVKRIINYDPHAKILMVTSHGEESTVIDALEFGAKGFILKPVTKEKLEEQFNKVKHDPYKMFRSIHYFKDLNETTIKELKKFTKKREYLVFLAEASEEFIPTLQHMAFDCVGGVFPELLYNGEIYQEGMLILEISNEANYKFIEHMAEPIDDSIKSILANKQTIFTIADALSPNIDSFLKNLVSMANSATDILGCGTGNEELKQTRSLFTPKGVYKDAAIIFYSHEPTHIGQSHGWQKLSEPYEINAVYGKTLVEMGKNKNPYNIYRNLIKDKTGIILEESNFAEMMNQYPLGIEKENQIIVRDVIRRNTNGLATMSDLPKRGNLYIMEWDQSISKESAKDALSDAIENIETKEQKFAFIFEGFERRKIENLVQNDISVLKEELQTIPQCGVVTLMEFSNKGSDTIEILNNSVVVGMIH